MKKISLVIIALLITASFVVPAPVAASQYVTGYTTGKVLIYEPGKKLKVMHHEGREIVYFIPETAEIPKDLKVGDKVEVKEVGKAAVAVEILSRGKVEKK